MGNPVLSDDLPVSKRMACHREEIALNAVACSILLRACLAGLCRLAGSPSCGTRADGSGVSEA